MKAQNNKSIIGLCLCIICSLLLASCDNADERYDAGYSDGYASGYNTTCKIRSTLIEGDWDNDNYSTGYEDGYSDGARKCREQ